MIAPYIAPLLAKAADDLERGCWWDDKPISDTLRGAWLVGAVFSGNDGHDYYARMAFSDWWAPAEHRNDGLRTNETADDKGRRLGRRAAVQALRDFVAIAERAAA